MANKRNRQKQRISPKAKTLEGYEKRLLQKIGKWESVVDAPKTLAEQRDAMRMVSLLRDVHIDLRRYYFNL